MRLGLRLSRFFFFFLESKSGIKSKSFQILYRITLSDTLSSFANNLVINNYSSQFLCLDEKTEILQFLAFASVNQRNNN